ncbi:hypothetical protein ACUH7Y_09980 [Clostridium beijerinckii]|nr:hypothetical protein [Clostridium beijerinckii]
MEKYIILTRKQFTGRIRDIDHLYQGINCKTAISNSRMKGYEMQ